ncbi:MAG: SDR family oxidoreductase [Gammaproteobacteria bacterium AqS3]|nr:SDR family oxidoreductase [Gammaproteobacteria bacterium AqS3]
MASSRPVAVVTGSSSGVGAATARQLSERGWNLVINYNSRAAEAERIADACRSHDGAEAVVVQADVGRDADCQRLVEAAGQSWGRLDALVNNAGTTVFNSHANLAGLSDEDFIRIYRTNLIGPYQMIRAAEELLRQSADPSVVNVASIAGVSGIGSSVAYAASKGALVVMTRSLARALGPIRINAVCPGFIEGEWLMQGLGEQAYEGTRQAIERSAPLGRVSTPDSVARTIVGLIESAPDVTGESLILDGGAHLGGPVVRRD